MALLLAGMLTNSQDGIIGPFDRYGDGGWVQLAKNQFQQVI